MKETKKDDRLRGQFHISVSYLQNHDNWVQIPAKSATQSGGSRPPVPAEAGHPIRSKAAGYRSEATLIFL
jgi:hypothetical protein